VARCSSPGELLQARFDWLKQGNFSAIYRSYHPDAQFREHFPNEQEYLSFAHDQGLAEIEIFNLQIVEETVRGRLAKIFSVQEFRFQGETHHYLDVTTLRLVDDQWYVLSGKRVACESPLESAQLTRDMVEKHPQAIVY